MIVPDVQVLLYAFDSALPQHDAYAAWLTDLATGSAPFGLSELVAFGFVRISTHPKILSTPAHTDVALAFVAELQARPNCRMLRPGPRHFTIFTDLCRSLALRGNLVSDAHHAAIAIEHDAVWATADSDFERFPDLMWIHPLHQALGRGQALPDFAALAQTIARWRTATNEFSGGDRLVLQSRCREAIRRVPRLRLIAEPGMGIDLDAWQVVNAFARSGR